MPVAKLPGGNGGGGVIEGVAGRLAPHTRLVTVSPLQRFGGGAIPAADGRQKVKTANVVAILKPCFFPAGRQLHGPSDRRRKAASRNGCLSVFLILLHPCNGSLRAMQRFVPPTVSPVQRFMRCFWGSSQPHDRGLAPVLCLSHVLQQAEALQAGDRA